MFGIRNRRAIEGLPFRLMVGLLLAAVLFGIGITQLGNFQEASTYRKFTEDYTRLIAAIDSLQSTSDRGGISRVTVHIPPGYSLQFVKGTGRIITELPDKQTEEFDARINIEHGLILNSGTHIVALVYNAPSGTPEPNTLYFT